MTAEIKQLLERRREAKASGGDAWLMGRIDGEICRAATRLLNGIFDGELEARVVLYPPSKS